MVWIALIRLATTGSGSTNFYGIAPCPPMAGDKQRHTFPGRHGGSRLNHGRSQGVTGHVMQGKNRIAGKTLKQAVVDHGLGPTQALLVQLENQVKGAVEFAVGGRCMPCLRLD